MLKENRAQKLKSNLPNDFVQINKHFTSTVVPLQAHTSSQKTLLSLTYVSVLLVRLF